MSMRVLETRETSFFCHYWNPGPCDLDYSLYRLCYINFVIRWENVTLFDVNCALQLYFQVIAVNSAQNLLNC